MKKVLLYSGGMDSYLMNYIWKPDVKLYINCHSSYANEEIKRLPKDVIVKSLDLKELEREDKIIPLRNLYFVMLATNFGEKIGLGATLGDRVLDKSWQFADMSSDLLSFLWQKQHWTNGKKISIELPFKHLTKNELLLQYKNQGGDLKKAFKESFSCYHPKNGKECWKCKPCLRKWVSFTLNGYEHKCEAKENIINNIVPLIENGTYGRKAEEEEILKSINYV